MCRPPSWNGCSVTSSSLEVSDYNRGILRQTEEQARTPSFSRYRPSSEGLYHIVCRTIYLCAARRQPHICLYYDRHRMQPCEASLLSRPYTGRTTNPLVHYCQAPGTDRRQLVVQISPMVYGPALPRHKGAVPEVRIQPRALPARPQAVSSIHVLRFYGSAAFP